MRGKTRPAAATTRPPDLAATLAALGRMTVNQLRAKYPEVFGEPSRSGNKDFLAKRLAWRIQSLAEGGLSERANRRAEELARDADLRLTVPRPPAPQPAAPERTVTLAAPNSTAHDRLPVPGTLLTRLYRGRPHHPQHRVVESVGGGVETADDPPAAVGRAVSGLR